MDRKIQFIMYDNGDVVAYDPEKGKIDESKIVTDTTTSENVPEVCDVYIGMAGNGSEAVWCPLVNSAEDFERWKNDGELSTWGEFPLHIVFTKKYATVGGAVWYDEDLDEDDYDISDWYIPLMYVGGKWFSPSGWFGSLELAREIVPGAPYYLRVDMDYCAEVIQRVSVAYID